MRKYACWGAIAVSVLGACTAAGQSTVNDAAPRFDAAFWEHWGDGRAELSGYRLRYPRYGEIRSGTAVLIFVTETFSERQRVKVDASSHPANDQVSVMKLNAVLDFPTGIYDYNIMTSSFIALEPRAGRPSGAPMKISFSSQEWCGHVYQQLLFDGDGVRTQAHSYFAGEADQSGALAYPEGGVSADVLWLWARGLAAPELQPGESVRRPFLRSLQQARLKHQPVTWGAVTLSRGAETRTVRVPAGEFEARVMRAEPTVGPSRTFYVEAASPHRLVKWERSDGAEGVLLGSERSKYWRLNHPEGRAAREKIGLPVETADSERRNESERRNDSGSRTPR